MNHNDRNKTLINKTLKIFMLCLVMSTMTKYNIYPFKSTQNKYFYRVATYLFFRVSKFLPGS